MNQLNLDLAKVNQPMFTNIGFMALPSCCCGMNAVNDAAAFQYQLYYLASQQVRAAAPVTPPARKPDLFAIYN